VRELGLALVRGKMEGAFRLSHKQFVNDIEDLQDRALEFQSKGDIRHLSSFLEQLDMLQKDMSTIFNKAHAFQSEERLLGGPISEFAELTRIEESMKPFIKMWISAKNFKESHREWLHGNVFDLDMDSIKQSVSTMISSMINVVEKLEPEFPSAASVASNVKLQLDQFKPYIPLIGAVANKGLRERHWEEVAHLVGFTIDPEEACSLQRLLVRGCGAHIPELEMISDSESKEWGIE
jgi:dynein heavy chain